MSKKVKDLITRDMAERFKEVDAVAVINPRGINAIKNNDMRRRLHEQGLRMTVVKNTLVRRAVDQTRLKGFERLLEGPSALVYGEASIAAIARLLMDEKRKEEKLELRGVFFEGEIYPGEEGVDQISKMPTREEAIANIVAAALSPGRKLAGIFKGQAGIMASLIKAVEEKAEKAGGEAAAA